MKMPYRTLFHLGLALAGLAAAPAWAASPLPQLDVDPTRISVSGLSAGGFAAGPYACAAASNDTACMYDATISASQQSAMQVNLSHWSGVAIDPRAHLAGQQIYLFVGNSDHTVGPSPMNALQAQAAARAAAATPTPGTPARTWPCGAST